MKKQLIRTGCFCVLLALMRASVPEAGLATQIGNHTLIQSAADLQAVGNNLAHAARARPEIEAGYRRK